MKTRVFSNFVIPSVWGMVWLATSLALDTTLSELPKNKAPTWALLVQSDKTVGHLGQLIDIQAFCQFLD
jgi:hypothetical protein